MSLILLIRFHEPLAPQDYLEYFISCVIKTTEINNTLIEVFCMCSEIKVRKIIVRFN